MPTLYKREWRLQNKPLKRSKTNAFLNPKPEGKFPEL
jgi:hypothetical protein